MMGNCMNVVHFHGRPFSVLKLNRMKRYIRGNSSRDLYIPIQGKVKTWRKLFFKILKAPTHN